MTRRRPELPDDAARPTREELDEARALGAVTGVVPVFKDYQEGSAEARSTEVPEELVTAAPPADELWAVGPDGTRMWGKHGAAGLLVLDRSRGVLLQHRALWSHFGGTWGIPGGALEEGESPLVAAVREAHEEAAVPPDALDPLFSRVFDLGYWSYTTFVCETTRMFEARITDAESAGLAWVTPSEVHRLKLHPGFGKAWPTLAEHLDARPVLIVDTANVVGSRPDGWWQDRVGATARLIDSLAPLAHDGIDAALVGLDAHRVWPQLTFVLEGQARDAELPRLPHRVEAVPAPGPGDDLIVEIVAAQRQTNPAAPVLVTTSDRELARRVEAAGASVLGAGALLALIEAGAEEHSTGVE